MPTRHAEVLTAAPASGREPALDVARGLAVLAMIYMHLVPTVGRASTLERVATSLARTLEGKSAVLFFVLAGISWALQARRSQGSQRWSSYVARRSLSIGLVGVALFLSVWSTEVLVPFALAMPIAFALIARGRKALSWTIVAMFVAVPIATHLWGDYAWTDVREDGTYLAESEFGWVTARFYLFDGNYPLLPWLAFALIGALCTPLLDNARRARIAFVGAAAFAVAAEFYARWARRTFDAEEELGMLWRAEWVPTSLPFVAQGVCAALAIIAGLLVLERLSPRAFAFTSWLGALGRASLTHYLLHVFVVFLPLRARYPDEDWRASTGLAAFAVYVVVAIPLSLLWFRRFRRGPLEELWSRASGSPR